MSTQAFFPEMLDPPGFLKLCGVRYEELGDDYCVASCALTPEMCNMHGSAHGGLIFTLMDTVSSRSVSHYRGMDRPVVAQCAGIHYLKPAAGERIYARSKVVRSGRVKSFVTVELYADDRVGDILAFAEFEVFHLT